MLCLVSMSKLYLKLTCFRFLSSLAFVLNKIFFFRIEFGYKLFFFLNFRSSIFISFFFWFLFCFVYCVTPGNCCSLPCCKEFLIGQFLCHQVSVWATRKCKKTKKKMNFKKERYQHQH